jgi:hypothetical protein
MIQAILIAQQIAKLFKCSRRKASDMRMSVNEASGLRASISSKGGKSRSSRSNESTDLDFDPAAVSTSGSETDSIASSSSRNVKPVGLPPGLPAPPGLEFPGQSRKNYGHGAISQVGDFHVKRQSFVPNSVGKNGSLAKGLRKMIASEADIPSSLEEVLKRRLERERKGASKDGLHWSLEKILT